MLPPRTGPLPLNERQVAAALGALAEAVTVQAADGRMLFANTAAATMLGFGSVEEMLVAEGDELLARYRMFRPDGSAMPVDELPGRRVLMGQEAAPTLVRWLEPAGGEPRWSMVKATPLRDDDGA